MGSISDYIGSVTRAPAAGTISDPPYGTITSGFSVKSLFPNGEYGLSIGFPVNPAFHNLFTTSAGSTLAESANDAIGRAEDLSGNSLHLLQSVSGQRPTLQTLTGYGLKPTFDLVDDAWSVTLDAGTYYACFAGESGIYFDTITHAGGTWTYGATAYTGGPATAITNLIGGKLIGLVLRKDTAFSTAERAQLIAAGMAAGAPGLWEESETELIANGNFDTDLTGWTDPVVAGYTPSQSGGKAIISSTVTTGASGIYQNITVSASSRYVVRAIGRRASGVSGAAFVRLGQGSAQLGTSTWDTSNSTTTIGSLGGVIDASGTAITVYLRYASTSNPSSGEYDSVSARQLTLNTNP